MSKRKKKNPDLTPHEAMLLRIRARQRCRSTEQTLQIKARWWQHEVSVWRLRIKETGLQACVDRVNEGGKYNEVVTLIEALDSSLKHVLTSDRPHQIVRISDKPMEAGEGQTSWGMSEYKNQLITQRDNLNFSVCVVCGCLMQFWRESFIYLMHKEGFYYGKYKRYADNAMAAIDKFIGICRKTIPDFDDIYEEITSEAQKDSTVAYYAIVNDMNSQFLANTEFWGMFAVMQTLLRINRVCANESAHPEWLTLPGGRVNLIHIEEELPEAGLCEPKFGKAASDSIWVLLKRIIQIVTR